MSGQRASDAAPVPPATSQQSHLSASREDMDAADMRREWEDGDVNPNFVQTLKQPRLLTVDGRFHRHDWKLAVSKVQPVQNVRRDAASRLVVRRGPPPGSAGLAEEDAVDPQVVSMFFGWLGNTYKAFNDRAREADYSLAILRDVIDDIRQLIGRSKLKPGDF